MMRADTTRPARILRDRDVVAMTGIPRASRYELVAAGAFPPPIALGGRRVGWLEADVAAWIAARPRVVRA